MRQTPIRSTKKAHLIYIWSAANLIKSNNGHNNVIKSNGSSPSRMFQMWFVHKILYSVWEARAARRRTHMSGCQTKLALISGECEWMRCICWTKRIGSPIPHPFTPFILSCRPLSLSHTLYSVPFAMTSNRAQRKNNHCFAAYFRCRKVNCTIGMETIDSPLICSERIANFTSNAAAFVPSKHRPLIQMITIIMNSKNEHFNAWNRGRRLAPIASNVLANKLENGLFRSRDKKNNIYLMSTRSFCSNVNL